MILVEPIKKSWAIEKNIKLFYWDPPDRDHKILVEALDKRSDGVNPVIRIRTIFIFPYTSWEAWRDLFGKEAVSKRPSAALLNPLLLTNQITDIFLTHFVDQLIKG